MMPGWGLLKQMAPGILLYDVAALLLVAAGVLLTARHRFRGKTLVYVVLGVVALRILLFENPLAWRAYTVLLENSDMDFRQRAMIEWNLKQNLRAPAVDYLAVGSSQAPAVFGRYDYRDDSNKLVVFHLPGMSTMEYVLYWDTILRYGPRHIILYLSEFDFGRAPYLEQIDSAPAQWFRLIKLHSLLKRSIPDADIRPHLEQNALGGIFPEYHNGYVYRALLDMLLGKHAALKTESPTDIDDKAAFILHINRLKALTDDNIPFHRIFLEEFLRLAREQGIQVIIVEGQYHPAAYTSKNRILNAQVREAIKSLVNDFPNARYIPRQETYQFTVEDYRDGYHVDKEAGYRFTQDLMNRLETG